MTAFGIAEAELSDTARAGADTAFGTCLILRDD
jgi:hypothetical protein